MKQYLPVFEKSQDQFVVLDDNFKGASKEEAEHIGLGASIVECVLWGARYTYRIMEIEENFIGLSATIDGIPIAIVGGENYEREVHVPKEMMN
jgi:hypothetical protein